MRILLQSFTVTNKNHSKQLSTMYILFKYKLSFCIIVQLVIISYCVFVSGVSAPCVQSVRKVFPLRIGCERPGITFTIWRVSGVTPATVNWTREKSLLCTKVVFYANLITWTSWMAVLQARQVRTYSIIIIYCC